MSGRVFAKWEIAVGDHFANIRVTRGFSDDEFYIENSNTGHIVFKFIYTCEFNNGWPKNREEFKREAEKNIAEYVRIYGTKGL